MKNEKVNCPFFFLLPNRRLLLYSAFLLQLTFVQSSNPSPSTEAKLLSFVTNTAPTRM